MIKLLDLTRTPELFFAILPADWRQEVAPYWPEYAPHATIYGLVENQQVIAGGIVFSIVPKDIGTYRKVARQWLDKGYLYLGFLFVREDRRKQGLGSVLVNDIRARSPGQKYWLAIDDYGLVPFYSGLGFHVAQKVQNGPFQEWILVD